MTPTERGARPSLLHGITDLGTEACINARSSTTFAPCPPRPPRPPRSRYSALDECRWPYRRPPEERKRAWDEAETSPWQTGDTCFVRDPRLLPWASWAVSVSTGARCARRCGPRRGNRAAVAVDGQTPRRVRGPTPDAAAVLARRACCLRLTARTPSARRYGTRVMRSSVAGAIVPLCVTAAMTTSATRGAPVGPTSVAPAASDA